MPPRPASPERMFISQPSHNAPGLHTRTTHRYTQTRRLLQMKAASVMVAVLTRLVVQGKAQIKTVDSSEEQRQNRGPIMLPSLHNGPKPSLDASPVNKGRYVMNANSSPQLKENISIKRPHSFPHRSCSTVKPLHVGLNRPSLKSGKP